MSQELLIRRSSAAEDTYNYIAAQMEIAGAIRGNIKFPFDGLMGIRSITLTAQPQFKENKANLTRTMIIEFDRNYSTVPFTQGVILDKQNRTAILETAWDTDGTRKIALGIGRNTDDLRVQTEDIANEFAEQAMTTFEKYKSQKAISESMTSKTLVLSVPQSLSTNNLFAEELQFAENMQYQETKDWVNKQNLLFELTGATMFMHSLGNIIGNEAKAQIIAYESGNVWLSSKLKPVILEHPILPTAEVISLVQKEQRKKYIRQVIGHNLALSIKLDKEDVLFCIARDGQLSLVIANTSQSKLLYEYAGGMYDTHIRYVVDIPENMLRPVKEKTGIFSKFKKGKKTDIEQQILDLRREFAATFSLILPTEIRKKVIATLADTESAN